MDIVNFERPDNDYQKAVSQAEDFARTFADNYQHVVREGTLVIYCCPKNPKSAELPRFRNAKCVLDTEI